MGFFWSPFISSYDIPLCSHSV